MEKATVNYSNLLGITARKSVKLRAETLDALRDMAAMFVNGDTYTYSIAWTDGKLKGYMEHHVKACGGVDCKCVFHGQRLKKWG